MSQHPSQLRLSPDNLSSSPPRSHIWLAADPVCVGCAA
ncbi:hypothetical protein SynMITS9220_02702 [Synechococcus sp. MIT S9220]|nr:hypothetical protein SynMITS9220_02702 [Synechococcus sp. MIT S9220]